MKTQALNYLENLITDETSKKELDLIEFIKKCVKEYKEREVQKCITESVDWLPYFEKLWSLYPRRDAKQTAKKSFERKIRGLNEQQIKDKCNAIYVAQMKYVKYITETNTELKFVKMYSTWLNSEVKNSPYYRGV